MLVRSSGGELLFRTGQLDAASGTIAWQAETAYAAGSGNAIAMLEHGTVLEAHVDQGRLFSIVGWLRDDGGIDGGNPQMFGTGGFVAVAANTLGKCVALHSGSGPDAEKLFCTPGTVNFLSSKVNWGESVVGGAGSRGSVSLSANGRCVVTFVNGGSVRSRSGQLDAASGAIEWFPQIEIAKGEAAAAAIDDLGRCVETHVAQNVLFYSLGRQ